jgi:hypothetical protein
MSCQSFLLSLRKTLSGVSAFKAVRDNAVGNSGVAEGQGLIDRAGSIAKLAARRTRSSCHGDLGSHRSGKSSQKMAGV